MRILGIRLRFTIIVALALAGYVAFLPQKIAPGRQQQPEPPQTPTTAATPQKPPQPGLQPGAVPGQPATPGPSATTAPTDASQLPGSQNPATPAASSQPPAVQPDTTPAATSPAGTTSLTPAQRAAAKLPPAPDSALPTTETPASHESDRGEQPGNAEGTRSTASPLTPNAERLTPITLGGPGTGIPIPPKPRFNRGQYLADTALSFRGLPYKWGGVSPDTGMDCSGFIVAVLQKWHIDVPHSVIAQYQLGKPVRLAEIQPGDLMFFKNTYKPGLSHVAIYVGDNQFVDAGDEKAGVMLRELGPHGMEHWVGGRRLDLTALPPAPGEPLLKHHQ